MDRLKRKRSVLRSAVAKLNKEIENLVSISKENVTEIELQSLEVKLNILKLKDTKLKELDQAIEQQVEEEELEAEIRQTQGYTDAITTMEVKGKIYLEANKQREMSSKSAIFSTATSSKSNNSNKRTVQLPKIELKKFDGDTLEWTSFWDLYRTSVHENSELSNMDKFRYLKTLLSGTAASAIAGLPFLEQNYEVVIQMLQQRFGDREMIINAHMQKLLSLKAIKGIRGVSNMRKLYDELIFHVQALKELGVEEVAYDCFLHSTLMSILPKDVLLDYIRHTDNHSLATLLPFFKKEVEIRERCACFGRRTLNHPARPEGLNKSVTTFNGNRKEARFGSSMAPRITMWGTVPRKYLSMNGFKQQDIVTDGCEENVPLTIRLRVHVERNPGEL